MSKRDSELSKDEFRCGQKLSEMEVMLGNRAIGEDHPVLIVAELSANHLQKYEIAVETIAAMKECGADAVKLQTFTPDTITIDVDNDYFRIKQGTPWDGKTLYQLYKEASMPWEWQPKLKKLADELGLLCLSSINDTTAADFLETMNMSAYKLPSFEITDIPLISYVASKKKPIILSTGIATLSDIEDAVGACKAAGNNEIILLKCTSGYPAPEGELNVRTMVDLRNRFGVTVGLSDHTLGMASSLASVALGARIIEKHFILDKKLGGPDASFSLEPAAFKEMVQAVRGVECALGKVTYELTSAMKKNREFARSLFVVQEMYKDDIFSEKNVRSIRPGYGLPPKCLKDIVGKKAGRDIRKGMPLQWDMIKPA